MNIVAFKLMGDYAHYSHPGTIYSSLTYPYPPKTTIMGLIAGIIGESDYEKLGKIKYSLKLENSVAKKPFIFNGVGNAFKAKNIGNGFQDANQRKQFYRELIKNPKYTIYLDLGELDEAKKAQIIKNLKEHRFFYMPYLGINFCIADFEWVDVKSCNKITDAECDVVSFTTREDFIYEEQKDGIQLTASQMPCDVEDYRIFKDFKNFIFALTRDSTIRTKNRDNIYEINGDKVYFV